MNKRNTDPRHHIHGPNKVRGRVSGSYRLPTGLVIPVTGWQSNLVMYDWGVLASALLRNFDNGKPFYINGMLLEFDNSGAPVDPTPSYDRDETVEYYLGLTGTQDFLRVPMIATAGSTSEDHDYSGNNVATFIASSEGAVGQRLVSPLTFSDVENSRIIGGALVAQQVPGDITQDIIFSRFYFEADNQIPKIASSQIQLNWELTFN